MIKKFILSFLLSLFLSLGFSQSVTFTFPLNNSYDWQNSVGPGTTAYCGTDGLFMGVGKSQSPNKFGSYEYNIYVASNSYTSQQAGCYLGYTYAEDIKIYCWNPTTKQWEYPLYFAPLWVNAGNSMLMYTLYSPNSYLFIKVVVGKYQINLGK